MLGNIFILGDSYSTFRDYIPEGYSAYYTAEGPWYVRKEGGSALAPEDVLHVEETWWYNLAKENGNLVRNCSWSGTTVCHTGQDGADCSAKSFIGRFEKLIEEGFFKENKMDTFFFFGGTNDSWVDSPLGEPKESGWTREDTYKALPGFSYLLNKVIETLPDAKIYCIINTGLKEEIASFYKEYSQKRGVGVIELCDIDKKDGHPTILGMAQIREQVLSFVKSK